MRFLESINNIKNTVEIDNSPFSGEEAVKPEAFDQYRAGNVTLIDLEEWFSAEMAERAQKLNELAEVVEAESGEEADFDECELLLDDTGNTAGDGR